VPAVDFSILNLPKFLASLHAAGEATPAILRAAMGEATLVLEAEARTLAGPSRDSGRLQGSISSTISGSGNTLTGQVGPSARYGLWVETGTRPHWPPRAPLEGWAHRHGIPVFLVQRAIARHGTRAQPFIGPALERTRGRITGIFAKVGATVFSKVQS